MATENPRKWPVFFLIIGILVVLVAVFVLWRFGAQGFVSVLKWGLVIAFILLLFGLVVVAIFWLFKKHKKEMVYIMRNAIIKTCKVNKIDYPQELWVYGTNRPFPQPRKIGNVIGFAMIKSAWKKMYDPDTKSLIELKDPKDVVFCTFNNGGFLSKLLGSYEVFAGVYPDDFVGDLTAPQVFINDGGFGLSPQLFKMIWCSKHWQEKYIIDETSKETIHRFIVEDNLNEIATRIEKAIEVEPKPKEEESTAEQLGLDKQLKSKVGLG